MTDSTRAIVVFLLIGLVAGWLAAWIVGGGGLVRYLISGVLGAFVGGYLLNALGLNLGINNPLLNQVATSTIGAVAVAPSDPNVVYAGCYDGQVTRYDHRTKQERDVSVYPDNPMGWGAEGARQVHFRDIAMKLSTLFLAK